VARPRGRRWRGGLPGPATVVIGVEGDRAADARPAVRLFFRSDAPDEAPIRGVPELRDALTADGVHVQVLIRSTGQLAVSLERAKAGRGAGGEPRARFEEAGGRPRRPCIRSVVLSLLPLASAARHRRRRRRHLRWIPGGRGAPEIAACASVPAWSPALLLIGGRRALRPLGARRRAERPRPGPRCGSPTPSPLRQSAPSDFLLSRSGSLCAVARAVLVLELAVVVGAVAHTVATTAIKTLHQPRFAQRLAWSHASTRHHPQPAPAWPRSSWVPSCSSAPGARPKLLLTLLAPPSPEPPPPFWLLRKARIDSKVDDNGMGLSKNSESSSSSSRLVVGSRPTRWRWPSSTTTCPTPRSCISARRCCRGSPSIG